MTPPKGLGGPAPGGGEVETLTVGTTREPTHRRTVTTRLLVAGLALLAVVALVVDRQARERESAQVARCVTEGREAVRLAATRASSIVGYVRPALQGSPPPALRTRLLGLVSDAAAPARSGLRRARDRCAATHVLWLHDALRSARDDCLLLLDAELRHVREVSRDGSQAFSRRTGRPGRCAEPDGR